MDNVLDNKHIFVDWSPETTSKCKKCAERNKDKNGNTTRRYQVNIFNINDINKIHPPSVPPIYLVSDYFGQFPKKAK